MSRALSEATEAQFLEEQASHDRLPRARIVGEQEPHGLAGQHLLVDRADLVREGLDHDPTLFITVELAPGEEASDVRRAVVAAAIQEELCRLNSEYRSYVPPERRTPAVTLLEFGEPLYFPVGVKHRYTRKGAT